MLQILQKFINTYLTYKCMIFFTVIERKRLFLLSKIKMTTFLIALLTLMPLQARGDSVMYSIELKNESLVNAMEIIREKTGYIFFYHDELVDSAQKVNLATNGQSIAQTLDQLLQDTRLGYHIKGNQVFLYKKNEEAAAPTETLQQANKIAVSGTVYDDEGLPIVGDERDQQAGAGRVYYASSYEPEPVAQRQDCRGDYLYQLGELG